MLVSGIIDLDPGRHGLRRAPGLRSLGIGLLVGINMIFGGSALIAMALLPARAARFDRPMQAAEALRPLRVCSPSRCLPPASSRPALATIIMALASIGLFAI